MVAVARVVRVVTSALLSGGVGIQQFERYATVRAFFVKIRLSRARWRGSPRKILHSVPGSILVVDDVFLRDVRSLSHSHVSRKDVIHISPGV